MNVPFPTVDPTRHLDADTLAARFEGLAPMPRDKGTVRLLVARLPERMRGFPQRVTLDADGMPGDAWGRDEERDPDAQLAVMAHPVACLIANGQSLGLFGDNLSIDLDLSADNLPPGTTIQLGGARVVVTPMPHNGCAEYARRFGGEALGFISAKERRAAHLRGVYFRVVEPGEVGVGDTVEVLHRGA